MDEFDDGFLFKRMGSDYRAILDHHAAISANKIPLKSFWYIAREILTLLSIVGFESEITAFDENGLLDGVHLMPILTESTLFMLMYTNYIDAWMAQLSNKKELIGNIISTILMSPACSFDEDTQKILVAEMYYRMAMEEEKQGEHDKAIDLLVAAIAIHHRAVHLSRKLSHKIYSAYYEIGAKKNNLLYCERQDFIDKNTSEPDVFFDFSSSKYQNAFTNFLDCCPEARNAFWQLRINVNVLILHEIRKGIAKEDYLSYFENFLSTDYIASFFSVIFEDNLHYTGGLTRALVSQVVGRFFKKIFAELTFKDVSSDCLEGHSWSQWIDEKYIEPIRDYDLVTPLSIACVEEKLEAASIQYKFHPDVKNLIICHHDFFDPTLADLTPMKIDIFSKTDVDFQTDIKDRDYVSNCGRIFKKEGGYTFFGQPKTIPQVIAKKLAPNAPSLNPKHLLRGILFSARDYQYLCSIPYNKSQEHPNKYKKMAAKLHPNMLFSYPYEQVLSDFTAYLNSLNKKERKRELSLWLECARQHGFVIENTSDTCDAKEIIKNTVFALSNNSFSKKSYNGY